MNEQKKKEVHLFNIKSSIPIHGFSSVLWKKQWGIHGVRSWYKKESQWNADGSRSVETWRL